MDNAGPVEVVVPRERNGSFEPVIVAKHQRRLGDVWTQSPCRAYAKSQTTDKISAHFEEIYGASNSKNRISKITDAVVDETNEGCSRPLLSVYAADSSTPPTARSVTDPPQARGAPSRQPGLRRGDRRRLGGPPRCARDLGR